jgi:preprotein translocase SecE subunit
VENKTPESEAVLNSQAVTLVFVVAALMAGNLVNSATIQLSSTMHWENPTLGGVVSSSVAASLVVGVALFFGLLRYKKAMFFVDSVVVELKKSAWPSREETINNTMIVIGATAFFSVLLALYDFVWSKVAGFFLYTGA